MADEKPKRRLPLAPRTEVAEEGDEERPPWHWSAIGTAAIFVAWLPLAYVVNGVAGRLLQSSAEDTGAPLGARLLLVGLNVVAFAVACFGGGFLVGRFGGQAGKREATVSGFAATAIAWGLATVQQARSGYLVWALLLGVMIAIASGSARGGGALGVRLRRR